MSCPKCGNPMQTHNVVNIGTGKVEETDFCFRCHYQKIRRRLGVKESRKVLKEEFNVSEEDVREMGSLWGKWTKELGSRCT